MTHEYKFTKDYLVRYQRLGVNGKKNPHEATFQEFLIHDCENEKKSERSPEDKS